MAERLLSVRQLAAAISPDMDHRVVKRVAARLGIPYYRLGRERLYEPEAVEAIKRGTLRCPDTEKAPGSGGGETSSSSDGPSQSEALASKAQALEIARKLCKSSASGSAAGAKGPQTNVVPITPLSVTS